MTVTPGALRDAVRSGPIETVKALLAQNADINERDITGNTALMIAAVRKDGLDIARLLLDNGASIDDKNNNGNTALIWAVSADKVEMVRFLIENGASPVERNNSGFTAYNIAASRGHAEIAPILEEAMEKRRKLDAEKARLDAAHIHAAQTQERLRRKMSHIKPR